jgi:hypothetical protein
LSTTSKPQCDASSTNWRDLGVGRALARGLGQGDVEAVPRLLGHIADLAALLERLPPLRDPSDAGHRLQHRHHTERRLSPPW